MYGVYQPYDDPGNDLLAQTAQLSIFFSLVASIVTNAYPNDPLMSALLPLFLAMPIALMVLFQLELLERFKRLMEPDEDGNVQWIGRIVLHVCRMANSQIERVSVSSAPEAAPNAAATSSNVAATDAGEMAARWQLDGSWMTAGWQLDAQARPRKGSKAVTAPAQVEMA